MINKKIATQNSSEILKAKSTKKIESCSDYELKLRLTSVFEMIGLTKIPSEEQGQNIVRSLKKNYSAYGIEEITLAFELAIKGELTGLRGKPLSIDHFQVFSLKYLFEVMNAYSGKRRTSRVIKPYEIKEPTQQEKDEIANNGILEAFENYKKTGQRPPSCAWMYVYLFKKGLIPQPEQDYMNEITEKAKHKLRHNLEIQRENQNQFGARQITERLINLDGDSELTSICRELALIDYFDSIKTLDL